MMRQRKFKHRKKHLEERKKRRLERTEHRKKRLNQRIRRQLLRAQENEITEYHIYKKLAEIIEEKEFKNSQVLQKIAKEEKKHFEFWKDYTEEEVKPKQLKIFFHTLLTKLFGLTFSVKLMEKGEKLAQVNYSEIGKVIPEAKQIEKEENEHERKLLGLLDEERLKYVGSMVLGVNDALVELTGALAGLTLAFQNTKLVALTGLITGIAASLSMGASEYLSVKAEAKEKEPFKAAAYTGGMYIVTVIFLIVPYFIFSNIYYSLTLTLFNAIVIILLFTFYISVAQNLPFKKRFLEMAAISLGVSALTFGIGYLVRNFFGIEI